MRHSTLVRHLNVGASYVAIGQSISLAFRALFTANLQGSHNHDHECHYVFFLK